MRRYRVLVWVLTPVFLLYTLWIALRHRDGRYFRERLGWGRRADTAGAVWVHAASVGEVNAAAVLIERLAKRYAPRPVMLTTVTPTGAAIARQRLGDRALHRYLPIDWSCAVRRMLRQVRPACLLVMETELWPNLYRETARAHVPIVLVNGRLSLRSLRDSPWWRRVQRETLACVRTVLARSAADAETFMSLGMEAGRVRTLGNLKFAVTGAPPVPIVLGRRFVLAASTREGEERPIVEQWRSSHHQDRLLVIAPRHPQRLGEILSALAPLGLRIAVRSRNEPVHADTEVYVADTFGELRGLMAGADLVIMGGSFVPFGGHNILEAAQLGRAVVFGPHMENFAAEAELLRANEGGIQLGGAEELGGCLTRLFAAPDQVANLGNNGARLVAARASVIEDYLAAVAELCPELTPASR